eukprot:5888387-Prymnesium_polylepis.2
MVRHDGGQPKARPSTVWWPPELPIHTGTPLTRPPQSQGHTCLLVASPPAIAAARLPVARVAWMVAGAAPHLAASLTPPITLITIVSARTEVAASLAHSRPASVALGVGAT